MEKFSVKKPFTILVMVVAIIILGFVSLSGMTTDLLPKMSLPYLLVITTYPGASPEKVESSVSEPVESALGSISGVKNVYSMSYENYGIVELEFADGTDMDSAMVKVSSALDSVKSALPEECGSPNIMEISMDMMASVYLAASYEGKDIQETSRFVEDALIPYLERQEGVTSISDIGIVENSISVDLNQDKIDMLNEKILAKTNDAFADAVDQLNDAKKQLLESEQKLADSTQELVDGQKDIDDGRTKLDDAQKELDEQKEKLEDAKDSLEDQKKDTENKLATASQALDQLNALQTDLLTLQAQEASLKATITQIEKSLEEQGKTTNDIPNVVAGLDQMSTVLTSSLVNLTEQDSTYVNTVLAASNPTMSLSVLGIDKTTWDALTPEGRKELLQKTAAGYQTQKELLSGYDDYVSSLNSLQVEKAGVQAAVSTAEAELKKSGVSYTDIEKAKIEAAAGFGAASAQISSGQSALNSAQTTLDSNKESLDSAQDQITEGWDSIADAKKQLADGWDQYNTSLENFEAQKAEALRNANADQLVNMQTLSQLIYAQNFAMPAGYLDDAEDNSWLLKVGSNYESVDELSNIVLTNIEDIGDVRLCDVADITVIDNADDSYARLNGQSAVVLSVFKSSTAGTNEVSKNITAAISELEEQYPGLSVLTLMDQGDYITMIINGVLQSMIVGAALAILVLALFLKDVKPTIVVAVSIPLSVLTALILMYFTGISLNMMSLSGLALGIGMLVDNSIVVIENIYRLRSKGVGAARAAVQGTKQVAGAIIASTLTTVCVFLPMVFTAGTVRELMMPISLTIIFTLAASLLIAMTVVPAAGSTLLRNSKEKKHPFFDKVQDIYGKMLAFCLKVKVVPLAIAIGLLVYSIWAVMRMGIVMIPDMTSNQIEISVQMPEDTDKEECYKRADQVLDAMTTIDGIGDVGAMAGGDTTLVASSSGMSDSTYDQFTFLVLTENENAGKEEVNRICREIEERTADIDCELTISTGMSEMSTMMGSGLSVKVYGDDLDTLTKITQDICDLAATIPGYENISNGQEEPDQVIRLVLDKDAAMRKGLTVAQIFSELNGKLTESTDAATVTIDGEDMKIVVKDGREPLTRENLLDYNFEIQTTDDNGNTVTEDHPLSEFATLELEDGVQSINRENQSRYMTVTATVAEGSNATLLSRELQPLIDAYELPDGYTIDTAGESDTVNQMVFQMSKVLLLGLALIYLVMVAQFQSLLSPFIVLFTVPLAFTGGLIGLLLMNEPLSVMGMMGFVVLLGTVVNNGIVFVDYANQLRMGGLERREALIATGKTRMRPILMTALTTILAMVSLLFGDDLSSQMSKGMAIVVAGGLAYATLMTLFIIPVMYDILFKRKPLQVDIGSENLDDVPDDAADYLRQKGKI
ncbi:efflux RND transporter permease subunit [Waltera intestinalis]|uniref:MMPL family transporter n=1 Tax=Waltera intestinalis TaxID=2606635 RepID=A0A6L5YF77_9FIRM|nr:efflux RND transporter permease subunit [Waltera intestinalis]MST56743.1 MMPL family transporter [Waltera intestinalis]